MKHLSPESGRQLADLLQEASLAVAPASQKLLLAYLDALLEANLTLNLTRISDPEGGIRLHLVDSLLALPDVAGAPEGRLLDIGTGGGVPGVPLCVADGRAGVLLDTVGKKSRAVNRILAAIGLDVSLLAVHERAEEHARAHLGGYAVVTARAVSELPALVELASPLLCAGGRLVALKGAPDELELSRGREAAGKVGMSELSVRRVAMPGGSEQRCLVVYERSGSSPTKLPRRAGEAQRSPLA